VVHESFTPHSFAGARRFQEIRNAVFNDAGADAFFHVLAATVFEDYGFDAPALEQLSEQKAGRTGADDDHLGANFLHETSLRCAALATFGWKKPRPAKFIVYCSVN
jgi:hypothetical protein